MCVCVCVCVCVCGDNRHSTLGCSCATVLHTSSTGPQQPDFVRLFGTASRLSTAGKNCPLLSSSCIHNVDQCQRLPRWVAQILAFSHRFHFLGSLESITMRSSSDDWNQVPHGVPHNFGINYAFRFLGSLASDARFSVFSLQSLESPPFGVL